MIHDFRTPWLITKSKWNENNLNSFDDFSRINGKTGGKKLDFTGLMCSA